MPTLCGLEIEHPVMNAAGTCRTVEDVAVMARSAVSAVVVGSITVDARAGNAGTTYHAQPCYSLNALGLPNRGLGFYREHLPAMVDVAHQAGKPLILSVAGFGVREYAVASAVVAAAGVDLIEINLGCPNVWDGGTQKRIASFDSAQTAAICAAVSDALADATGTGQRGAGLQSGGPEGGGGSRGAARVPYGVKISPFSDPAALADLAAVLADLAASPGGPRYVASSNTFPNGFALDPTGRPVIDVELAGLAGPALRPIALGQVRQLRRLLPEHVQIVGVGGVTTGRDVADFLRAGASAVQVATAFWNKDGDPTVFGEIAADWATDWADPADSDPPTDTVHPAASR
jgi:dihydroorotate dehydrogenase (fumarate)